MSTFHIRIRQLRRTQNMSQEELARKLGISRQALIAIEQGASLPSLRVIFSMLDALNTSFNELFGPTWSPFREPAETSEESQQLSIYRHEERPQTIPVTLYEDSETFHIYAELAGVKEDDVSVDLSSQHVLIVAVKRAFSLGSDCQYHINEITPSPLLRIISIPSPINPQKAQANLWNGLLHLILPKDRPEISRRITFNKEEYGSK